MKSPFIIRYWKDAEDTTLSYPIIAQLRPHICEKQYCEHVEGIRQKGALILLAFKDEAQCLGCLIGSFHTRLSFGKILYIEDLSVDKNFRSIGVGKALLDKAEQYAQKQEAQMSILDSATHRKESHKFYFQNNYHIASFNFKKALQT